MGWIQKIRERLGLEADIPDSGVIKQALSEALQERDLANADIHGREQRLGLDSIRDPDGDDARAQDLAQLRAKRDTLTAKCDSLQRELDAALEREADDETISQYETAAEKGRECSPLVRTLIEVTTQAATAAQALLEAHRDFVGAVPWSGVKRFASARLISDHDVAHLIILALKNPHGIEDAIAEIVRFCVANAANVRSERENKNEPAEQANEATEVN
jgi:hypothetical protein